MEQISTAKFSTIQIQICIVQGIFMEIEQTEIEKLSAKITLQFWYSVMLVMLKLDIKVTVSSRMNLVSVDSLCVTADFTKNGDITSK